MPAEAAGRVALRAGNLMIEHLVSGLFELLVVATGRQALKLFSRNDPNELVSMLAGFAVWILAGFVILALAVSLAGSSTLRLD
jgi:hypothetical protein